MILIIVILLTIAFLLYAQCKLSSKLKSLKDKHVVITGGSSGIGESIGIVAAKHGAHVTILARDESKLKSAQERIKNACINSEKQKISAISLDVTDHLQVEETLKKIDQNLPVFMLVNCAGMAICGTLEEVSISDNKKLVELNFMGTLYSTRTLVPFMKQRKEGIIVMTASQAALLGIYGMATYSATKYALRGLAEALDMEVRPFNISVTLSLPPDTDTPGLKNENISKPIETQLISESGGLFSPDEVANNLINDALNGKFYSYIGFESFMLSTLCCGMTPFTSFFELLLQVLLIGPFRLISSIYVVKFQNIIKQLKNKKD